MAFDELAREDVQEGRICMGKSRKGDAPDKITITLDGRVAYAMQSYLESQVCKGGDFSTIRLLVILAEALRHGVVEAKAKERETASSIQGQMRKRGTV
ncbi:MAG: hypothetical protein ABSF45_18790 [Terriglobia bacterium]